MLRGLMQEHPLLVSSILTHAAKHHRGARLVGVDPEGGRHRSSWPDLELQAKRIAAALRRRGVQQGERIATLGWNGLEHLAVYYAASGMGAVLHTVNPRLFADQIAFILEDAGDTHLFLDPTVAPALTAIADRLPKALRTVILLRDAPHPDLPCEVVTLEEFISAETGDYEWPQLDERAASSLCYTSGTTGMPKGVLYSHRSTVLHAMAAVQPDVFALSAMDVAMPVVPMFHVNGWGIPYAAPMVGASMVLPGPRLDPASLFSLFEEERVSFSAGVPTIWTLLLQWLRQDPSRRFAKPPRLVVGGTALPVAITEGFLKEYDVPILHAWGMTEISPLGSVNARKAENADWDEARFLDYSRKQGRPEFGVDFRVLGADGNPIPQDETAFGELEVRGHWTANGYFNRDKDPAVTEDGWFRTGDVVTLDALGEIEIVDRAKDVIKSGGEWISSITLENLALAHPDVQMAAAIPVAHPKWDERPLLLVVPKPGTSPTPESVLAVLEGKVAKWWMPDRVEFVETLPLTATGKLWKAELKRQWKDFSLPG
ncbi:long-chain-fatty-acid--CoA ligase [Sabulicella glaciei]|uniref:Long-chain-fatty-acid--CoA ligase n=1 Tax=Sabulicella glaciei TaxID=2984948 RepID=A0ABT3NXX0_9PROT|nr:long-chain-fatty-acid--CoA ligase [Roseococcus sp. MDT2-1-1]MCW8087012.1 long-chain-fatty-acid--CoA ligase [Roseococcus sp. MDT2-1-1]